MAATGPGLQFKDKVAIVTGGCKGIGRGCVDVLVDNGGKVVIWDIDDTIGSSLPTDGPGELFYIHCDTTKEEDIKAATTTTVEKYGQIDLLVNNAGWHPPSRTIDEFSATEFRQLLDLNLVGYFLTCKYCLPYIRKTKGSVVQISSVSATIGQQDAVTYCASKGGISSMTRALAIDEAKHGVRINTISPGQIWTPMFKEWADTIEDKSFVQSITNLNHMRRFGDPREIGEACLYLATKATYTTGIDMPVSAGYELGGGAKRNK